MSVKRVIIWGASEGGRSFVRLLHDCRLEGAIVAIVDSDPRKEGTELLGARVAAPSQINHYEYDAIVICSVYIEEILEQITRDFGTNVSRKVLRPAEFLGRSDFTVDVKAHDDQTVASLNSLPADEIDRMPTTQLHDDMTDNISVFYDWEQNKLLQAEDFFMQSEKDAALSGEEIRLLRKQGVACLQELLDALEPTRTHTQINVLKTMLSMLHTDVLVLLYLFARHKRGTILEIGPYVGGATIAMAWGAHRSKFKKAIVCIEPGGQHLSHPYNPSEDIISDLKANLSKFGVSENVCLLEGYSQDDTTLKNTDELMRGKEPIALLCIDADGHVKRDIRSYRNHCSDDCILVVDDYFSEGAPEKVIITQREIDELVESGYLIEYGVFGWGTWVGRLTNKQFDQTH